MIGLPVCFVTVFSLEASAADSLIIKKHIQTCELRLIVKFLLLKKTCGKTIYVSVLPLFLSLFSFSEFLKTKTFLCSLLCLCWSRFLCHCIISNLNLKHKKSSTFIKSSLVCSPTESDSVFCCRTLQQRSEPCRGSNTSSLSHCNKLFLECLCVGLSWLNNPPTGLLLQKSDSTASPRNSLVPVWKQHTHKQEQNTHTHTHTFTENLNPVLSSDIIPNRESVEPHRHLLLELMRRNETSEQAESSRAQINYQ